MSVLAGAELADPPQPRKVSDSATRVSAAAEVRKAGRMLVSFVPRQKTNRNRNRATRRNIGSATGKSENLEAGVAEAVMVKVVLAEFCPRFKASGLKAHVTPAVD